MKARLKVLSLLGFSVALIAILFSATTVLAQDSDNSALPALLSGGIILFALVIFAAFYIYAALSLQTIANKTNTADAWLAWIPIANVILMLNIAKKPMWWIVLFLIPLVSIVFAIIVWMEIAKARNKPDWWGILIIVPLFGIVVPGYLAWSD